MQTLGPGDLVVVDEMAHARINPRRHLGAHPRAQLGALDHARFGNMRVDIAAAEEHRRAVEAARFIPGWFPADQSRRR